MIYGGILIEINSDGVKINGDMVTRFPYMTEHLTVKQASSSFFLIKAIDITVMFGKDGRVYLLVDQMHIGKVSRSAT